MKYKLLGICVFLLFICSGSKQHAVLQPHFTLTQTSVELAIEDTFDPYAYVLKNTKPIEESDKEYLVIEGTYPQAIPGEYEITYNQYMKLHITMKDTVAPQIEASSFTWNQGIPFVWNEETMHRIQVSDNYSSEEYLRSTLQCEDFDTAYIGVKHTSCIVRDEADNVQTVHFDVNIVHNDSTSIAQHYAYLEELPYTKLEREEIIQVLAYVNQERVAASLSVIELGDLNLMNIAYQRALEVKELYSHDRPNGELCFTILDEHDYEYKSAGENIAKGQQSSWQVMQDWQNSQTHRSIIETPEFTKVGIAVIGEGEEKIWLMMFVQ